MVTFRQAKIKDLPLLQKLNQEIMVNNPKYDSDLIENFAYTKNGEQFFRESIEREDGCCLIAEEEGEMIGYTDGGSKDIVYRKSKYFEIDNLGVIPEMKGKGVGKMLLKEIREWAKNNGYNKIYLSCYALNQEALKFYKKNGFEEIDIGLEMNI